jgi:DNA-binding CsgD family transcriptional regulator
MYNEFYRRLHLEHVLGINLPTESGFIGVSPLRAAGEFGQRERELITLLRPHLVQAYRAAELRTEMSAHLALFARGVEVSGLGVILLRTDDRVARLNRCARAWVAQQFHADLGEGSPLPPALQSWLREIRADGELIGMPSTSFERDGQRLRACLLTERGERMIVLRTSRTSPTPQDLAPLHLARRESEVLLWLAMGKTDSEIAQILGVSPRTVSHTLERVYRKLGVETRLAAALRALQTDDWAVRCT